MNKRNIFGPVFLIAAAFLFGACDRGSEVEKNEAIKAVRDYNAMLQMAYLQADLNLMGNFATQKEVNKLFPVIQMLQVTNSSMIADQTAFKVKRVSVEGDKAWVRTKETWVYWWQDRNTAAITKPKETITYKIKFNLIKEKGKWKVDSLEEA